MQQTHLASMGHSPSGEIKANHISATSISQRQHDRRANYQQQHHRADLHRHLLTRTAHPHRLLGSREARIILWHAPDMLEEG